MEVQNIRKGGHPVLSPCLPFLLRRQKLRNFQKEEEEAIVIV
jgi:hypothetical protein